METPLPNEKEIRDLIQFLPFLYREGFSPVKKWRGGEKESNAITMPFPEYEQEVLEFMAAASKKCWCDYQYDVEYASQVIEDLDRVASASLPELKTLLTYCVRGERFCDGHMGSMIEKGVIKSILIRLQILVSDSFL